MSDAAIGRPVEAVRLQGAGERPQWWSQVPAVKRRINRLVSGDPDTPWYAYVVEAHLPKPLPVERCLDLGCGEGWLERRLAGMGVFRACDAYDLSAHAIEQARRMAAGEGWGQIHYAVADASDLELPADTYDAVWVSSAMHYFERLEYVCGQIRQSLKPEGVLVMKGYVGPSRFQFPERQKEAIRAAFSLLPLSYRRPRVGDPIGTPVSPVARRSAEWAVSRAWGKLRDGDLVPALRRRWDRRRASRSGAARYAATVVFPTARDIAAADPSEAVRSAEILEVVSSMFTIVERKDFGGTVLQFALDGISDNFRSDDPEGRRWLELLFQIEDTLIDSGELQSDFAVVVARPRAGKAG